MRSELTNIDFAGSRGAVITHEQLRSEFTTKANLDQNWTRNSGEDGRPGSVFGAVIAIHGAGQLDGLISGS